MKKQQLNALYTPEKLIWSIVVPTSIDRRHRNPVRHGRRDRCGVESIATNPCQTDLPLHTVSRILLPQLLLLDKQLLLLLHV